MDNALLFRCFSANRFPFGFLELTSPWMLLWGVSVLIPIAIHYWRKRSRQRVAWGAMRFLHDAMRQRSRRAELESWVLLVLRSFLLLLLAFACSQPFFPFRVADGRLRETGPRLTIFVLDVSASMDRKTTKGRCLDIAKEWIQNRIASISPSTSLALITLSQQAQPLALRSPNDRKSARQELAKMEVSDSEADLSVLIPALRIFVEDTRTKALSSAPVQVVILTDLGENTWNSESAKSFFEEAQTFTDVEWQLVDCFDQPSTRNRWIRELRVVEDPESQGSLWLEGVVGQNGLIDAIQEGGRTPKLEWEVNGNPYGSVPLNETTAETQTLRIPWQPDRIGTQVIRGHLSDDSMIADNQRWLIADNQNRSGIMIYDSGNDEGKYLQVALESARLDLSVQRKKFKGLSDLTLQSFETVILCDIPFDESESIEALRRYVERGGRAMIWLGAKSTREQFLRYWKREDWPPFAWLQTLSSEGFSIDPLEYRSPALRSFRDFPESGLLNMPINRLWEVELRDSSQIEIGLACIDPPSQSHPLFMTQRAGLGKIQWILTDPTPNSSSDLSWNGIAAWPSFVPLVHGMIRELLGNRFNQPSYHVGDIVGSEVFVGERSRNPSRIRTNTSNETSPEISQGAKDLLLLTPDRKSTPLPSEWDRSASRIHWSFEATRQGIYRVQCEHPLLDKAYAVNLDDRESSSKKMLKESLPELFGKINDGDDHQVAPDGTGESSTMHRGLLLVVLGCLLFELGWATWWMRGRT